MWEGDVPKRVKLLVAVVVVVVFVAQRNTRWEWCRGGWVVFVNNILNLGT